MVIANEEQLSSGVLTAFPPVQRLLVIAPHPDDEVFGCGGTLARLKSSGVHIVTIIVTDGALGGNETEGCLSRVRADESRAAARVLGLDEPLFWRLPDRGVLYGELLIERLMAAIREHRASLVLLPSPTDWHPDHQALAFAGAEAVRRLSDEIDGLQAVFYEVTDPLPNPNLVCDISSVETLKAEAMQCFHSQLQEQPYADRIAGINRFRAMHLGATVASAETFMFVHATELDKGLVHALEGSLSLTQRRRQGYATSNEDLPLVSVIVRSMDRPTLKEALDSVALQTWSNIEIVLVNAKGAEHQVMPATWGHLPLQFVSTGNPVHRTRAANMGLDAARGEYLMFLDDDDWFDADHVEALVQAIRQQSIRRVAYGGIRCVDENRQPLQQTFDTSFNPLQLLAGNYMPIHAVLFSRTLLACGCRFDESLDVYEDWDFWIQLSRQGDFLHVPGIRAVYRIHSNSGFGLNADAGFVKEATDRVYLKWQTQLNTDERTGLMFAVFNTPFKDQRIIELEARLDELLKQGESLVNDHALQLKLAEENKQQQIAQLELQLERQLAEQSHTIHHQAAQIDEILHSTSWKITAPMRGFVRLLRGQSAQGVGHIRTPWLPYAKWLYWQLPARARTPLLHWAYRHLGRWFRGMPHYEQWRMGQSTSDLGAIHNGALLLIDTIPPAQQAQGRIAIHLHMYYHDLADEFAGYLRNMPFEYDLYVSVATDEGAAVCKKTFSGLAKQNKLEIERVPNRGRDIAPMFCTFGERLKNYDFVAHLHSKKSLYNKGATEGWRQYLCGTLFGSEERIRRIFELMQSEVSQRGIVYPQNYHLLPYAANTWLANRAMGSTWCTRLGIQRVPQGYFDFPAGSMFWARIDALKPLFEAGITLEDFAEEAGQTDGTFAHCLERLLALTSLSKGYEPGIIKDLNTPSWSTWSLQQYIAQPPQWLSDSLNKSDLKVIAFDIFDTLLCRPLLDAESIKNIVAARHGGEEGALYLQYRAIAEGQARELAGRDVGMKAIYARLGQIAGLSDSALTILRSLEEDVEVQSVVARPDALALYRKALSTGKSVILISDMFLPRATIEKMLDNNGITNWHHLFLSNEIGLRKDSGKLYDHVIEHYNIVLAEMVMIGDNERSDLQIPSDKGIATLHVMRPVDLARGLPRLRKLIDATQQNHDLHQELTLGLLVQQEFSPFSFPQFDPSAFVATKTWDIGYSVLGPLLTSMVQWLIESARNDRVDRLYFLSREGQLIKKVYDIWCEDLSETPKAEYLVLSRRTVSVAALKGMDDILDIARTNYFSNTIAHFLFERYGLKLSRERWKEIAARLHWTEQRKVEVVKGQIDHLEPLLAMLQDEIIAQAQSEHQALMHYLGQMELEASGRQAVVDIGYGGTIQGYLNQLLANPLHGYYMMTDERSAKVAQKYDVMIRACFMENVAYANTAPPMYLHNFELEKLLSSSDTQIVHYSLEPGHPLKAHHRDKSAEESACVESRTAIQEGAIRYARDARDVRTRLYPDFRPSCTMARQIYEAFMTGQTTQERDLLRAIALDDHYCGREVVC